jgi:hypothetical protein
MSINDYRSIAEDCMRHADRDQQDKPLWVTLAQSWLRLAQEAENLHGDGGETPADHNDLDQGVPTAPH